MSWQHAWQRLSAERGRIIIGITRLVSLALLLLVIVGIVQYSSDGSSLVVFFRTDQGRYVILGAAALLVLFAVHGKMQARDQRYEDTAKDKQEDKK